MINTIRAICSSLILLFILASCGNSKQVQQQKGISQQEVKDPLIEANKSAVKKEADMIEIYVKNHHPDMLSTGTGLRYKIYQKGTGELAQSKKIAKVNYKISLLDGTLCYSSDAKGPKEFMIGQDNVESGLHEGILYMHVGDKALFILPSHLAHGLMGDEDKIPPKASLLFDIELLSLK